MIGATSWWKFPLRTKYLPHDEMPDSAMWTERRRGMNLIDGEWKVGCPKVAGSSPIGTAILNHPWFALFGTCLVTAPWHF